MYYIRPAMTKHRSLKLLPPPKSFLQINFQRTRSE